MRSLASSAVAQSVLCVAALVAVALFLSEYLRPQLLLVGNVTVDVVDGKKALGGAIAYAAAVASALGVRACVVTAGGKDADFSVFRGHQLHQVPTNETLTFEHSYTWWGHRRKLKVTSQPAVTLTAQHVPRHCRRARTVLLGPLTPQDLDAATFVQMPQGIWDRLTGFQQQVGLMAQGLQRGLESGKVVPYKTPSADLQAALGPTVSVFLSDVETDPWPVGNISALASRSARWLVTRGEHGADEYAAGVISQLPAVKTTVADTNGAGDTFATAYMLALALKDPQPGAAANWAASRAVAQPQACKPHCVGTSISAERPWGRAKVWASGKAQQLLSAAQQLWQPALARNEPHSGSQEAPATMASRLQLAAAAAGGHVQRVWQSVRPGSKQQTA